MSPTQIKSTPLRLIGRLARFAWKRMPESVLSTRPLRACGVEIHKVVSARNRISAGHLPCTFTRFFRNVPLLEVLRDLETTDVRRNFFSFASSGCSAGVELYSLLWHLHNTLPNLHITAHGVDLSRSIFQAPDLKTQLFRAPNRNNQCSHSQLCQKTLQS
jgi:hypothetical protein